MRQPHLRMRGPFLPPLDQVVQYSFEPGYVVFTLPAPKRIRVVTNGTTIADTTKALIVFESDHIPIYYFPLCDIRMELFEPGSLKTESTFKGVATHYSLKSAGGNYDDILWCYEHPAADSPDLSRHGSFYWHHVDQWLEEDEEVFVHARDPFKRVDCLPSSRTVLVEHEGQVLAESSRSIFLFETGLPTRHYLPLEDTNRRFLETSDTRTRCPYKGEAQYNHVRLGDTLLKDCAWYYADPVHEAARVRGLVCFAAEFVSSISVDRIAVPRPETSLVRGYNYHGWKGS